jgi:hypothetical protein
MFYVSPQKVMDEDDGKKTMVTIPSEMVAKQYIVAFEWEMD